MAGVMDAKRQPLRGARLLGGAEALYGAMGIQIQVIPAFRSTYERLLSSLRAQLDEDTFNAAWAEGRVMTTEQLIHYALGEIE